MKTNFNLFLFVVLMLLLGQANARSVHIADSKLKLAEVSDLANFTIVRSYGNWNIVRFKEAVVPVWVSADYVRYEGKQVITTANRLNMRVAPSMTASVLGSVARGYQSQVVANKTGFVQILAPVDISFAVPAKSSTAPKGSTAQSPSKWVSGTQTLNNKTVASSELVSKQDEQVESGKVIEGNATVNKPAPVNNVKAGLGSNNVKANSDSETKVLLNQSSRIEQSHHLSPGDTISLLVFGEPDLSLNAVRIPQSGLVSFPLIGSVLVSGKTTNEVETIIRQSLSEGYIRNPRLSISIESYRPIFIKGAVYNIGAFPYTEGLTIAKALALAGGTKNSAQKNGVHISRDGALVRQGLSVDSEYQISSGDIISVEEEFGGEEGSASYVYLHGEVRSPGEYQFRRGLTVEKAIVLAGGFSLRASRKKVTVSRIVEDEEAPQKLKKVPLYLPVQPGDIIDVGASWF